ncbi:ABC transporter ATP-binding protein [Aquibacillus koreensis]|uniref:ABC transporter ATP-binding protein n=1 Tax=Aquibacillus koreensis TaxID=279446 RepID=A0A9X3WP57_9BACI|nr:ABC transporter ATP-binding protein [Aquibacillus koreensis]MCT2534454.1 ABC transporter ATP-binding protein [Aquibacillus koreensis]MDC3421761.1 ABC transporter ATP-binding protein [Aquibacillus koreensis]
MATSIIELKEITKQYDDQLAVDHLSLSIKKGEIFGLLGPNGAGKSTTILMMLGLSEPTSGTVHVCGLNPTRHPLGVKQKVGYLPDDVGFYQHMTGLENLMYTAALNGMSREAAYKRAMHVLDQVGLVDAATKKNGKYSRGMRQRLGLADVLMKKPDVIILDEPTLGIDPEGIRELLQLIRHLNEQDGITVLLSSHQLHQVQQICDRVGIFVKGKLLAEGNIESLAKQLFFEDTFVVNVFADPIDDSLIQSIHDIHGVNRVEMNHSTMDVYCQEDVTPDIARTIIQHDRALYHINKKNYGLDEIYHRYFEGRELNEATK